MMAILSIYAAVMIPPSHAFPLYGDNGVVNATVYGVKGYEYGDGLYIDISASDTDVYDLELIDSDDNVYSDGSTPYRSTLHGFPTETRYNGRIRDILLFGVPKDAAIKRLRVVPTHSDPFYIEWTDMPEASSDNMSLKFYGAAFEPNGMRWLQGNWNLDVAITNKGDMAAGYNSSDFALKDQFGWLYPGKRGDVLKEIPAGQSLRFTVKIPYVSEISTPLCILFEDIELNISGWA